MSRMTSEFPTAGSRPKWKLTLRFARTTRILNNNAARVFPKGANPKAFAKPFKPPTAHRPPKPVGGYIPATSAPAGEEDDESIPIGGTPGPSRLALPFKAPSIKPIAASSFYAPKAKAPAPAGEKIVIGEKSSKDRTNWGAAHDPTAEGAVVMTRPTAEAAKARYAPSFLLLTDQLTRRDTEINDVVLDPALGVKMRPHQREGVKVSCASG